MRKVAIHTAVANRGYAAPVFASRYRSLATPWLVAAPPLPNIRRPASRGSEFRFIAQPGKRKEEAPKGKKSTKMQKSEKKRKFGLPNRMK